MEKNTNHQAQTVELHTNPENERQFDSFSPEMVCLEEIANEATKDTPDQKIIRPFAKFLSRQNGADLEQPLHDFSEIHGQADTEKLLEQIDQAELDDENNIVETANFQGSHTLVQFLRMSSPDFRQKFQATLQKQLAGEQSDNRFSRVTPSDILQTRLDNFEKNLQNVYKSTGYGPAESFGKQKSQLGVSQAYGEPGAVFADGELDDRPLTDRQKDIISAHENHHAIVLPNRNDQLTTQLRGGLDLNQLNVLNQNRPERLSPKYVSSGWEIAARMAQIKNYFGMTGGEVFTKEHLDYAKKHYVIDTGLDNNMNDLLAMITEKTEANFIHNMNNLPI